MNNARKSHRLDSRSKGRTAYADGDLREQVDAVGEDLRKLASTATASALELANPIEEYIQKKPLKSVLIAAGVGALIGIIFRHR